MSLLSADLIGQSISFNAQVNLENQEVAAVARLIEAYLSSNPQDQKANSYWNQEDQERYTDYDFLESEFQPSLYMGYPAHVLSITKEKDHFRIKVKFAHAKAVPPLLAIVNYVAKKQNGVYRLYNALEFNRRNWERHSLGMVQFYHPSYHQFDSLKAQALVDFIEESCMNFAVIPRPMEYYFANSFGEVQALRGFDYYLGEENSQDPSGKAAENKVYCGGMGEYYPHEVFHVQIDPYFPNKHFWLSEGIATLLGGSRGENLNWHIKRCHAYLEQHPEIDLSKALELRNMDDSTAYHYVLGGLIAQRILEKGGYPLLIEFMQSGKTDQEYYAALERFLGVAQSDLNQYLRAQLRIEAGLN